jgi:hypothetical protein
MIKSLILIAGLIFTPELTEKDFIDCINIYRFLNGKPEIVVDKTLNGAAYRTDFYEDRQEYLDYDTINVVKTDVEFLIRFK